MGVTWEARKIPDERDVDVNRVLREAAVLAQIVLVLRKKAFSNREGLPLRQEWQPRPGPQVVNEEPHDRKFKLHVGLPFSRCACYERRYVVVAEIFRGDPFPFHPTGEGSGDRSFFAERAFGVTSVTKVFEERFDLIIKEVLGRYVSRCECCHMVAPYLACCQVGGGNMIMPRQRSSGSRQEDSKTEQRGIIWQAA